MYVRPTRQRRRCHLSIPAIARAYAVLAVSFVVVTFAVPAVSSAGTGSHRSSTNLVLNGGGRTGAVSVQGWDSVTIPGWQVAVGLPTVVRHGTAGFPTGRADAPARLFAGGPGGSAVLAQRVRLRSPHDTLLARGTRYRLSAWLGGTSSSAASVTVTFFSTTAKPIGRAFLGPVGETKHPELAARTTSGRLPRGAASAEIRLHLATTLTDYDGPRAPKVGYNRAVAGRLALTVGAPVRPPRPLVPPVARVPRFDHVFVFMFENQDFRSVIGNRRQAPYLNGLLPRATLLSNLFAEEHPSDGNYLALAAGGVFGIPLTDPLEENPRFKVSVRHIGDLVDAAHETWRAYLQSAAGPCDDTVHGYYWNDDLPFLYFPDVRGRPAYCSAHVVPLQALSTDLARARTTPNFAWVGANDCADMEGCGIRAGDAFLAKTLGAIMRSPAWRTQRSLAIITFDEDAYDHEHPPQRVPTVILGSRDVRASYVSHVRYTHYSLLRTIEAALRLGTLTKNDRYARPLNDAFDHGPASGAAAAPSAAPSAPLKFPVAFPPGHASAARVHESPARKRSATAFVVNYASGSVTPVSLANGRAEAAIRVGTRPTAIALSPRGHTAYVVNSGSNTVTPIDTLTRKAGRPIPVGSNPRAITITPTGATAYVVNGGSDTVTPIDTASGKPGRPIAVGSQPRAIGLTPDGKKAFVLNWGSGTVTPIDTATNTPDAPVAVGSYPSAIAVSADAAYVANYGSDTVTPVSTSSDRPRRSIRVGQAPDALVVTPDGKAIEVVCGDAEAVTPIAARSLTTRKPIPVGYSPTGAAMGPHGATAWVVSTISGTVTPIDVRADHARRPISVGRYSYPTAIALAPGDRRAVVLDTYAGRVSLIDTRTGRARPAIKVGGYPVAVAIAP